MKDEALKLALEALKELVAQTEARLFAVKHDHVALQNARKAITAIKQALAAPVQEPVAWQKIECPICGDMAVATDIPAARRQWVGLTKDEVETLSYKAEGNTWTATELAEAKLKEKNT